MEKCKPVSFRKEEKIKQKLTCARRFRISLEGMGSQYPIARTDILPIDRLLSGAYCYKIVARHGNIKLGLEALVVRDEIAS